MTNQQHQITPPPELVEKWYDAIDNLSTSWKQQLATRAAQWGWDQRGTTNEAQLQERADQELEACIEWFNSQSLVYHRDLEEELRKARRPKPPTLKKEALKRLEFLEKLAEACGHDPDNTIRLALEALPE